MDKRYLAFFIGIIISTVLLTSCWDQIEIDERAFILALGVDKAEAEGGFHRYSVAFEFPNQKVIGGGEPEVEPLVLRSVGENIDSIQRLLAPRSNRIKFLGHLKVVVIGEEVARNERMLRETMDALERNQILSRRIHIAIAKGTARDIFEVESDLNPDTGQYIADVFRRRDRTQRAPMLDFNEIVGMLHRDGNALIPRIIPGEKDLKIAGSAIIRKNRMVGWLEERENLAVNMVRGEVESIVLSIPHSNMLIPYEITSGSSSYSFDRNNMKMTIKVTVEGDIEQLYLNPKEDIMDYNFINDLQNHAAELIAKEIKQVLDIMQKQYKTDVFGFHDYLNKFHHSVWRNIKNDWDDEVFPNMEVEVKVDAKIRRLGLTR